MTESDMRLKLGREQEIRRFPQPPQYHHQKWEPIRKEEFGRRPGKEVASEKMGEFKFTCSDITASVTSWIWPWRGVLYVWHLIMMHLFAWPTEHFEDMGFVVFETEDELSSTSREEQQGEGGGGDSQETGKDGTEKTQKGKTLLKQPPYASRCSSRITRDGSHIAELAGKQAAKKNLENVGNFTTHPTSFFTKDNANCLSSTANKWGINLGNDQLGVASNLSLMRARELAQKAIIEATYKEKELKRVEEEEISKKLMMETLTSGGGPVLV
ncbi:hypothetical protein C2845_PM01G38770 [Panicum miliaceum]|uniref:Uncharacterized protein n=1 Tax=Panicum miliaceum TaxID=4540 RepID=A0A3L6TLZ4_PANMI|nr:hypothetical protein C2845_PM01G38770 [Panicum miliaceum]